MFFRLFVPVAFCIFDYLYGDFWFFVDFCNTIYTDLLTLISGMMNGYKRLPKTVSVFKYLAFRNFYASQKQKGKKNENSHSTKSIIFDIIITIAHCHCCTKVHKSIYFSRQLLPVTINSFHKIFIGMPNRHGIRLNSCSANIQ